MCWRTLKRTKPGQDFGFGEAYYLSLDYGFELGNGVGIGLHIGHHDGDFAEAFNGNAEGYYDYNVTISKGGFTFMISDTDVKGGAAEGGYDNDQSQIRCVLRSRHRDVVNPSGDGPRGAQLCYF